MSETHSFAVTLTLRAHAADALRRARRLPIGPARNDLRQLAIGLRCLEMREQQDITHMIDIPPGAAPLAPL